MACVIRITTEACCVLVLLSFAGIWSRYYISEIVTSWSFSTCSLKAVEAVTCLRAEVIHVSVFQYLLQRRRTYLLVVKWCVAWVIQSRLVGVSVLQCCQSLQYLSLLCLTQFFLPVAWGAAQDVRTVFNKTSETFLKSDYFICNIPACWGRSFIRVGKKWRLVFQSWNFTSNVFTFNSFIHLDWTTLCVRLNLGLFYHFTHLGRKECLQLGRHQINSTSFSENVNSE